MFNPSSNPTPSPADPVAVVKSLCQSLALVIHRLKARQPVLPVMLNPICQALNAPELGLSDATRRRAREDARYAEISLAHRKPLVALRMLLLLQRRIAPLEAVVVGNAAAGDE